MNAGVKEPGRRHIRSPKPLVKRVRAYPGGREVVPAETDRWSRCLAGCAPLPAAGTAPAASGGAPGALRRRGARCRTEGGRRAGPSQVPLTEAERARQILFDLSGAANVTLEERWPQCASSLRAAEGLASLSSGWGNPPLAMRPSPRVLEVSNGVRFLTGPDPALAGLHAEEPPGALQLGALPLPAGATIQVMRRCERLWPAAELRSPDEELRAERRGGPPLRGWFAERSSRSCRPTTWTAISSTSAWMGCLCPSGIWEQSRLAGHPSIRRTRAHADVLAIESDPTRTPGGGGAARDVLRGDPRPGGHDRSWPRRMSLLPVLPPDSRPRDERALNDRTVARGPLWHRDRGPLARRA